MGWFKKTLLWCAIALVIFTLFGFFAAPLILKSVLLKELSASLNRDVSIGKISVNPFTLRLKIEKVLIAEKGSKETLFSLDEMESKVSPAIIKGNIVLRRMYLKNPYLNIIRNEDGTYNISDLMEKKTPQDPIKGNAKKSTPLVFAFRGVVIENGSVDFLDGPLKKKHIVRELNLTVPFISNIPRDIKTDVQPILSLKVNGSPYIIRGKTKPFADSRETSIDINIDNIDIPYYLAYLPMAIPYKVASGNLDIKLKLIYIDHEDKKEPLFTLTGDIAFTKLTVNDATNKPLLNLPELNISLHSIEPLAGRIRLAKVSIQSPEIMLSRDENGALNIPGIAPEKQMGRTDKKGDRPREVAEKIQEKGEGGSLQFLLDNFELNNGKVIFQDFSFDDPVRIAVEQMEMKGENISLAKDSKGTFFTSLVLNKKGMMNVGGTFGINPLTVEAKTIIKNIDIRPFEPYFTDMVKISVVRGSANANGDLSVTGKDKEDPRVSFRGTASITRFASVDKENADDLFSMESIYLRSIYFQNKPTRLLVKSVALSDFFAHIAINADKTINIEDIFVKEDTPQELAVAKGEKPVGLKSNLTRKEQPPYVKIDAVTLQGGTIDFHDNSVEPHFSRELTEIGGRISGLSSDAKTMADVELRGKFDRYAPLEIVGKINPLREDLYVDLKASFKDMDLSPVTPYSGKYIGYIVDKGKLSFDVQYFIENKKLDSKNSILIDQLTLGNRVESPDATKLPVRLAIALLKDRKGQIKLDIPVTGSLDDPQFSVWRVVLKILVNLLAKAATSPFALLGSLFGGGEELGYVEFDYGRDILTEANVKKLDTLTKALQEKPGLRLDITGHVDVELDREGLKQYLLQKKARTQKLKDLLKKSSANITVDEVKIEPQEYEKYLRLAYKAEKFPKPRNVIGLEKTIPVEEMEKLILTHTEVKNEDLRSL
ncbi:MAG: hypothetical protein C0399_12270, partial [Syntrophus sp. (in: bacteria)]|nr:hypothetical protein [Syntrophus sp. (in: bacteria)]